MTTTKESRQVTAILRQIENAEAAIKRLRETECRQTARIEDGIAAKIVPLATVIKTLREAVEKLRAGEVKP